ncbi:MAG: ATP-binding cassette domain-containing protein [Haemophilus parainfluenzae]
MAIEIRNITKSYGSKRVVDNVSLTVPTGKITSFIGPNGAGKSTVLSIMSRLLKCVIVARSISTVNCSIVRKVAILRNNLRF